MWLQDKPDTRYADTVDAYELMSSKKSEPVFVMSAANLAKLDAQITPEALVVRVQAQALYEDRFQNDFASEENNRFLKMASQKRAFGMKKKISNAPEMMFDHI